MGCGNRFLVNQGQVGTIQGQVGTKDKKTVIHQKCNLNRFDAKKWSVWIRDRLAHVAQIDDWRLGWLPRIEESFKSCTTHLSGDLQDHANATKHDWTSPWIRDRLAHWADFDAQIPANAYTSYSSHTLKQTKWRLNQGQIGTSLRWACNAWRSIRDRLAHQALRSLMSKV